MADKKFPDFSEYMKMFDPANISKMFDPKAMMEQFGATSGPFDPQETIKKAQGNFEAMAKANQEAAASYRDLLEKQMQIFQDVTAEAAEQLKSGNTQDAQEVYQQSVERALRIMTELSEATREANQRAFEAVKGQVDKVLSDIRGA
ncbi:hypothetical protein ACFMPD_17520 [Sedimentitalea sp. HM32M-2]|uniref:hypothetical protein n=1 Tax=Sedimentitalea sp. HM32M-2 TaxID=3351566 RepID=UPI003629F4BB